VSVCGTPWRIAEIRNVWPKIAKRIPGPPAVATDILLSCVVGEALCLESPDGVLILTLTPDERGLELALFVLLAVGYLPGAYQRRDPDLDIIAADLGASSIVMCPRRRGWARLLGPHWIRQGDAFIREVQHGGQAIRAEADSRAARAG